MKLLGGLRKASPFIFAATLLPVFQASAEEPTSTWIGHGTWTDSQHWSHGLPSVFSDASIRKHSDLSIPHGTFTVARLNVGTENGDFVHASLNGGHLLIRQDSLIVGEYTGSHAEFDLNSGELESVMDIFVGGATGSSGRMNESKLRVRGGTLIGLSLTIGEGLGSDSDFEVIGSKAKGIRALEFIGLHANADLSGRPGRASLTFTLDEHGVTPITISSHFQGLRIDHDAKSSCNLHVNLAAPPPRDDVTLIASEAANEGEFSGLPEGAQISSVFGGNPYTWTLTYHGGRSGHDVVLHNVSSYSQRVLATYTPKRDQLPEPSWYGEPVFPLALNPGVPAFKGAEGYGAFTKGGTDGQILRVENLNDAGPGSLRAALETSGRRTIQFTVGGDIILRSKIIIRNPDITVDGSSAPAPGITLMRHGIEVRTHDVILRQLRIRIGDKDVRATDANIHYESGDGEYALYFTEGSSNAIADHLSLSWSTNKILSTTKFADRITVQWCVLAEALNLDQHGYASIAGGNRVTWHHNLFAHNFGRNPRFQGAVDADFRNNVIYDWGETSVYGEFDRLNFVNNYFKPGPSTIQKPLLFMRGTEFVGPESLYLAGNVMEDNVKLNVDNWRGTGFYFDRTRIGASQGFPSPAVVTTSAEQALNDVIEKAGANLPDRDSLDRCIVSEVVKGRGQIIQSPQDALASCAPH
jgi:pectate lyase